jgi:hypothetical protein
VSDPVWRPPLDDFITEGEEELLARLRNPEVQAAIEQAARMMLAHGCATCERRAPLLRGLLLDADARKETTDEV